MWPSPQSSSGPHIYSPLLSPTPGVKAGGILMFDIRDALISFLDIVLHTPTLAPILFVVVLGGGGAFP